ncbi:unnamed protein product [Rhodiola kirilowii]
MWLTDPTFTTLINSEWKSLSTTDTSFPDKLMTLQQKIQRWNRHNFGPVKDQIQHLRSQLATIQEEERNDQTIAKELSLSKDMDEWLRREEILWQQRSRVTWLAEGDSNTKYFHACATARHRNSSIRSLQRSDGTLATQSSEIATIAYSFYRCLFSTDLHASSDEIKHYLHVVPRRISPEHNAALLAPYSEEEITRALFQMHPSKAPGIDGFSTGFFQSSWHIVKHDFISECLKFLNHGLLNPTHNTSVITLIPKLKGATKITEFRPISLIGVVAKVISKAMANRLQGVLDEVISHEQCAFIRNRLLSDNLIIAQEISHYINSVRNSTQLYASLKLDMAKAYDRLEWTFLDLMLRHLGFDSCWVDQIMHYVKSSSYLLRINGIRISRRAPSINHLLFADDSLLFMKIQSSTLKSVRDVLHIYEYISGQSVNLLKSEMVVSKNVTSNIRRDIDAILGVKIVPAFNKYLGLPVQMCRKKVDTFTPILDKLHARVQGWKMSRLSAGGKEVLITSVLNSVPQYWLSTFLLPDQILDKIQSIINNFWWSPNGGKKGVHWIKKEILKQSKEDGGLGFRDWKCLNLAFLAKQAWRLQTQPHLLVHRTLLQGSQSNTSHLKAFWKTLWKLPIPKKIRIFAWRGYQGALPTGAQIRRHHLKGTLDCPICSFQTEDEMHAFVHCWWATAIWDLSNISCSEHFKTFTSLADLFFFCHTYMPPSDFAKVLITCWYIWYHRNSCRHNGLIMNPRSACYRVMSLIVDFQSAKSDPIFGTQSNLLDWSRPPVHYVKINCDASWYEEDRSCGIGAWARDHEAITLAVRSSHIPGCPSVIDAEGTALRIGMELAADLKLQNVIFESDSADAVTSINHKVYPTHWEKRWFIVCCRYLQHQQNWKLHLIRREANGQADALARKSRSCNWHWTRLDAVPYML